MLCCTSFEQAVNGEIYRLVFPNGDQFTGTLTGGKEIMYLPKSTFSSTSQTEKPIARIKTHPHFVLTAKVLSYLRPAARL